MQKGGKKGGGGGGTGFKKSGRKPVGKSAVEIENDISSTQTVTWDPLTVLPEAVYLKIFHLLDNPDDKERFMNAHPKWYNIFKLYRTQFLFGKVLETLADNGSGIDPDCSHIMREPFGLIDSDYLTLRRVCRDWDAVVQKHVQLHPYNFRLGGINEREIYEREDTEEIEWLLQKRFGWFTADNLEETLTKIKVTHPPSRNPFLNRNIRFSDTPNQLTPHPEQWRAQVDDLLEAYGHHVWHCQFTFREKVDPDSLVQFVQWLALMPNLKTLKLRAETVYLPFWPMSSWLQVPHPPFTKKEIRKLEKTTIELPEMAELSVIKCEHLVPTVFNKLFGGFTRPLEKLLIFEGDPHEGKPCSFQGYQLPLNIKEARIFLGKNEDFDHLKSFAGNLPLLRTLSLHPDLQTVNVKLPEWEAILNILEETFPELEQLNLSFPMLTTKGDEWRAQEQSLRCQLNLPKLKKLRLILSNVCSFDFIRPLKELEHLTIIMQHLEWDSVKARQAGMKEFIKVNMLFEKMWESNIWEVLPKLTKLRIMVFAKPTKPGGRGSFSAMHEYGYGREGSDRKYIYVTPSRSPRHNEMKKIMFRFECPIWWF